MTTISWKGGTGNFNTGSFWSGGTIPGSGDTAVVDVSSGMAAILLDGKDTVASLTLNDASATLTVTGTLALNNGGVLNADAGSLIVASTIEGGTLAQNGATIRFTDLNPENNQVVSPQLLGVAVTGTLDISATPTTLEVTGLAQSSLAGIKIGAGSELLILDPEVFTGQTIDLAGGVLSSDATDPNNGTIGIGFGTEVLQNTPSTAARIGPNLASSLFGLGSVVNHGTIIANAGTLILDAEGGAFTSQFHVGPFTNAGTIKIGAGATVVDDTNSTFAGLGSIVNSGGLLDLKGTLTNTNATVDVAASGGFSNLQLDGMVIGGTILEDVGSLSVGSASLQHVTVVGTGVAFDTLTVGPNTVFNPAGGPFVLTAQQAAYGQIVLNNGAVLTNAAIAYGGTQYQVNISVAGDGVAADGTPIINITPSATLDSTTTLNVGAGQVLRLDGGSGTLVNNAVINVEAGGQLDFVNAATYVAGGTINVGPGSTVQFTGNIGLNAISNVVGTGALLTNLGNLDLGGGTISTSGNANFSKFENGGQITDGTVITNSTQNPNLGVIYNATLVLNGGVTPVNSLSVNNAKIQGALQLTANGEIDVYGNLDLKNQAGTGPGVLILDQQPVLYVLGSATSVQFKQSVTVSNATVLLSGVTPAAETAAFNSMSDLEVQGNQTVTLAPSVLIVATTVNGPIGILGGPGYFVNEGTIAVIPGADLVLGPYGVTPFGSPILEDFINKGLITIAAGGTLDVATQSSILALGSIVGPGGLMRLDTPDSGPNNYDNTGNTLIVGGPTGAPDLEINSTAITGGTIVNAGGRFAALGGILNNVTYVGDLDLTRAIDLFGNSGTGYLAFNGGTLESQSVTLAGATLLLGADQTFSGATLSLSGELGDTAHTLSFDANTSVTLTGGLYMPVGHFLNAGTITIGPGTSLQLSDFSAGTPEPSATGTIVVNNGTFFANVLDSGQTLDLGPNSSVNISRFDAGSQVVFQAPNTLNINQGAVTTGSFVGFGVGDTIALTGYEDGPFAQVIFGNNNVPHGADPTITLSYDGETLNVVRGGTLTIAALAVGAGYDVNGFTATPVGTPSVLVTGYNITYAPPGQPAPVGPSIAGTQANQATDDLTAIAPFTNVVLSDPNVGAVITAQVTFPTYTGTLTAPAGGTLTPNGAIWLDTGSPAAVQAALRGMVYTPVPHSTAPGQALNPTFTITVNDQFASVMDTKTSVLATAVEDPILISGVIPLQYASDQTGGAQPFKTIVVNDPDNTQFTATATLSNTTIASFGNSFNATISPSGVYSTSGALSTVQTALRNLVIYAAPLNVPTGQTAVTVTMSISDHIANTASATSTVVIVASGTADAAGLRFLGAVPGQTTTDQIAINPFANAIAVDKKTGALDSITITMSNPANGVFSDLLGTVTNGSTFTASGTVDSVGFVDAIDSALAGLVFTPTRGQVPLGQSVATTFNVLLSNDFGTATDASTSVIATAVGATLAINGAQANQELADNGNALPLASVTIQDSQLVPVETATATLSNPSSGALTAGNGGTVGSDGVFRVNGPLAAVQSALQTVGFVPAAAKAGQMVTSGVTIGVSDGSLTATDTTTSLFVIGSGAAGSVIANNPPTAGLSSSGPTLTPGPSGSNQFFLNLGTVTAGSAPVTVTLTAQNLGLSPADTLVDTFAVTNAGGFTNAGFAGGTTLSAGGSAIIGTVTLNTGQVGAPFETITLTPTDANTLQSLPIQTVTVSALVTSAVVTPAPAIEVLNSAATLQLPNVRVGAPDQQAISLSNGAAAPADTLSVNPVAAGQATVSGVVAGLAAGGTDATDILVGLDTTSAGARLGTVTMAGSSVDAGGTSVALANPPMVTVSGNAYRPAVAAIAPVSAILHVGAIGVLPVAVSDSAANDGFSEALIASIASTSGSISATSSGPSGDILPGGTNVAALAISVPTTQAGTVSGTATVALTSDGGGEGGIDGLGTTTLTSQVVPVSVTVNNFANPVFEELSNIGTFSGGGTAYALDLGTVQQLSVPVAVAPGVLNNTTGPSDVVSGDFQVVGSDAFTNSGLVAFGSLAAGQSVAPTITLQTGTVGTFSETITLTPTASNTGGYSAVLPAETLTVTGTVVAPGTVTIAAAVADVLTASPVNFGKVHVGATARQSLAITNSVLAPAAALDASVLSVSGDANGNGTFSGLTAGATDASSIAAGINTGTVGPVAGGVTLGFVSDAGASGSTALPNQTIAVAGTVYREAAAALLPLNAIVHVGDTGTVALPVSNAAVVDGFSENLIAALAASTGGFAAAGGPTGEIAAGTSDAASLVLDFSTTQAGTVSGTATVALTSDGGGEGGIDGLGTTTLTSQVVPVSVTVNNFANPVFEELSNIGTFSGGGTAYALDLGTLQQGSVPVAVALGVLNNTSGPSDVVSGGLQAIGSGAFTNAGLVAFGSMAAGQSVTSTITLATGTVGTFSETITLTPTASNAGSYSAALPAETLTVTGTVEVPGTVMPPGTITSPGTITLPAINPAVATVLTASPINFGNVHAGATARQGLAISNTAAAPAAALDASVGSVSGDAQASGSFAGLAAGGTNVSSITVGIDTGAPGPGAGNVTIAFVSDAGGLGSAALPGQSIAVAGTVYREAAAALLPLNAIVHVGDPGVASLLIANSDPADGYSENLTAKLIGTTGNLSVVAGGPVVIAAGATNTGTVSLGFSTAHAGTVSGTATIGMTSDGGAGAGSIDGLGMTTLTAQTVPVNIVIDDFAVPSLTSAGNLAASGANEFVLNLGTAIQGAAPLSTSLNIGNVATGQADWLNGAFAVSGAPQFSNSGLAGFSTLGGGTSTSVDVSLSTSDPGVFTETIMLTPTDANASGFASALAQRSITVTGTILASAGTATGDVHMVTFDGQHYDFQAVGDFTLVRSTVEADPLDVQIRTAPYPVDDLVSVTTEVAARVGQASVWFDLDGGVMVNGVADTDLGEANPTRLFDAGRVDLLAPNSYRISWTNGAVLTVANQGIYFDVSMTPGTGTASGSVHGLLGSNSGQDADFQLPDGTILTPPVSDSELLGEFANAWRVAPDQSMLNGTVVAPFNQEDLGLDQPMAFAVADHPGEILTGGLGVTYVGTMADFAGDVLAGWTAGDRIDVMDLYGGSASVDFHASGNGGDLTIGSWPGSVTMRVIGGTLGGGYFVIPDQHGGSQIGLS